MKLNENIVKPRKALIVLVSSFAIFATGASCSGGTTDSSAKPESQIYAINQDVESSGVVWKVTSARDRGQVLKARESRYASIAKDKPTQGRFIEVSYLVENKQADLASITEPTLHDGQSREFTSASNTSEWIPEGKEFYLLSNLQPNLPKEFVVIYEIPADAAALKVKVGVKRPQMIELGL